MDRAEQDIAALDLSAIAARVREVVAASGVDGTEFAAQIGVPYSTMRAYIAGKRPPSAEFLAGSYRKYSFLPAWLLTGEGSMRRGEPPGARRNQSDQELVPIPRYDVAASAGHGIVSDQVGEYRTDELCVTRAWLAKRRLAPATLRVIQVRGNSMQGVLSDGDLVMMDTADTKPRSGFVYVIRHDDELLVKYCEQMPNGLLRVSSHNPAFAPYDVDPSKAQGFIILGRVVASMHDW